MIPSRRGKVAWGAALTVTVLVSAAGLAHTPLGRAVCAQLTGASCNWGAQAAATSAADFDAQMRVADANLRGHKRAATMPALGFGLTITRRDAFEAWAYAVGGHCHDRDQGLTLECTDMPLARLTHAFNNTRGTVRARFDTDNKLREVVATNQVRRSEDAAQMLHALTHHLTNHAGPPHRSLGEASAAYLAQEDGGFTQSATEYRFSDYYAKISATNMGTFSGFRMVQKYRALDD